MKIIKSGKHRTGRIKCTCGCEFEWEESDIYTCPSNSVMATIPPQYQRFLLVDCPECGQRYRVGIEDCEYSTGIPIINFIDAIPNRTTREFDFSEEGT